MIRSSVLAIGVLFVVAGCATSVDGKPSGEGFPSKSSVAPTPTPSSSAGGNPVTDPWVSVTDPLTGVKFQLPAQPKVQKQSVPGANGDDLDEHLYQVQLSTLAVSVGTLRDPSGPVTWNLDKYAAGILSQFQNVGATDATILNKQHFTFEGHPALKFRFSFTSETAEKKKSVWLISAIDGGAELVIAQTVGFAVDPATLLPLATSLESRLLTNLALP